MISSQNPGEARRPSEHPLRNGSRLLRRFLAPGFVVASIASILAPFVFARAGGGGHYSGGGGSFGGGGGFSSGGSGFGGGHGGSGGGDVIFYLFYFYIRWATANPLYGVPVTAIMVYVIYQVYNAGSSQYVSVTINRGIEAQEGMRLQANLAKIKARDPGFEGDAFLSRAEAAFLKIQQAWCGLDMAPARAFVSDGVMERFSLQLSMRKSEGKHDRMEQVSVLESRILEIESDPQFDTFHVCIRASAIDVEVSLKDGSVTGGDNSPEEFTEIWSFLRRPGAKTLGKPGLIEGFCPNCGAPLRIADAARCGSCQSWVNSGEYDWVLSEITQACEWSVRDARRQAPGLALLARTDPGLNVQFLEDRASVIFWRWQYSLRESNAAWMKSVATDAFCSSLAQEIEANPVRHEDAAVGGVDTLAVEPADPFDRAHILVKWSAEGAVRRQVLILQRRKGAVTDARSGLVSMRCPGCGAPPKSRDVDKCEYCGHPFNDGSRQWVLAEIVARGTWSLPTGVAAPASASVAPDAAARSSADVSIDGVPEPGLEWGTEISPADAVAVLVGAMMSDGQADGTELAYLRDYADKRQVPSETVKRMVEAAKSGMFHAPQPANPQQAQAMLRGLIRMSLADGKITGPELRALQGFAGSVSIPPGAVRGMLQEERDILYRQAKEALAARKKFKIDVSSLSE